ncbi:MAG: hypothetical protein AAGG09_19900 [Pseudomonadota bacterium]
MPRRSYRLAGVAAFVWGIAGAAAAQEALETAAHSRLMARIAAPDSALAPFTTDGCSGGLSEIWADVGAALPAFAEVHGETPPWEACCVTHDRAYHEAGGATDAEESYAARRAADAALRTCVQAEAGGRAAALHSQYGLGPETVRTAYVVIAAAMYRAVRVGGVPCSGLPWRWGYGWPDC